ncbi:MAG: hypothetical protein RE471_03435 [Ferroplasma sp.]|uniref:hypothetical protein n=1 Tax=Ferroplasma sp. TaxID=2591003 RepID=UPI0028169A33|nr:hypothetical protein [Ferroplasma sp.]WMT51938.1 MAG: hypothetical protein RE471_03435 [Ferroplasma sp.]
MGIDLLHMVTDYSTGVKFLYPVMILVVLTILVTVHSRKFRKYDDEEVIHKIDLKIPETDFLKKLELIKSGDFSSYISMIDSDINKISTLMREYRTMVKKYNKYNSQIASSSSNIMRKRAIRLKDECLMGLLQDLESMRNLRMSIINEEVYEEWKKKQKQ